MLSTTNKHRPVRFRSFVVLISVLFSLTALVTTTSSHRAQPQGKPTAAPYGFDIAEKSGWAGPVIRVTAKKNKQVYDTVETTEGGLRYLIQVRGRCGGEGAQVHLSYASVDLYSGTKHAGTDEFPVDRSHRSIGANHGQGWNPYEVVYPYLHPKTHPIEACNDELKRREGRGESHAGLLQRGFDVNLKNAYDVRLQIGCAHNEKAARFTDPPFQVTERAQLPAVIRCMPTGYTPTTGAPSEAPREHLDQQITSVVVTSEPAESKGHACPVYVGFRGRITAGENRPGDEVFKVKYRFMGDRGFSTPFYEETLRKGETKPVYWKRRIEALPIGGAEKEMASGVKPKLPVYQGWTILHVVYPERNLRGKMSEKATFTVDCNPPPQRTAPPRGPKQSPHTPKKKGLSK